MTDPNPLKGEGWFVWLFRSVTLPAVVLPDGGAERGSTVET
jgi:hypothetical protein